MRLLVTRHGKTEQNINGIIQGKEEGHISDIGFQQIRNLKILLKEEKIDRIISSDVPRCVLTTKEILKSIKIPVSYTNLIREKDNGELIGRKANEVDWQELGDDFENRHPKGGESLVMVRDRGREFFSGLVDEYGDTEETILIVSHGGFLKVMIGDLLGMSIYDSIFKLFINNCSLSEIEVLKEKYKEGYQVRMLNYDRHLINPK
jgi:probable phosphoglycerate mutase